MLKRGDSIMLFLYFAKVKQGIYMGLMLMVFASAWLFEYIDEYALNYGIETESQAPSGSLVLRASITNRVLELYNNGRLYKRYRIAVGKKGTPTPAGEWIISYKCYSPIEVTGTRWFGLDIPWGSYGIHGTNMPWSIGCFASHGCIRMNNRDVEELYQWVPEGTPVFIDGPREKITRVLRRYSIGPDVVTLHFRLVELGYFYGRANGTFTKETEAAVRAFERDQGLRETGVVDEKLLRRLGL
jgi:hypothetical protein